MPHANRHHDKFSPSGGGRWIFCTGSVDANAAVKRTTSHPAELGTAAHELLEKSLKSMRPPAAFRGEKFNGFVADDLIIDPVDKAFDYIRGFMRKGAQLLSEQRVYIGDMLGGSGTLDAAIFVDDTIHLYDYKNGRKRVPAKGNEQMMLYTLGFLEQLGLDAIAVQDAHLHIVQPNANPDIGDMWTVPIATLTAWGRKVVRPAATAILAGKGKRVAGPWCSATHCPQLGKCAPAAKYHHGLTVKDWA